VATPLSVVVEMALVPVPVTFAVNEYGPAVATVTVWPFKSWPLAVEKPLRVMVAPASGLLGVLVAKL